MTPRRGARVTARIVPLHTPQARTIFSTVREEGRMKIRIDKAACVGNARCAAVAEQLFPLDENGYIAVEEIDVPKGMEELAERGARACPERIIVIEK
jgi:ferredoxin